MASSPIEELHNDVGPLLGIEFDMLLLHALPALPHPQDHTKDDPTAMRFSYRPDSGPPNQPARKYLSELLHKGHPQACVTEHIPKSCKDEDANWLNFAAGKQPAGDI